MASHRTLIAVAITAGFGMLLVAGATASHLHHRSRDLAVDYQTRSGEILSARAPMHLAHATATNPAPAFELSSPARPIPNEPAEVIVDAIKRSGADLLSQSSFADDSGETHAMLLDALRREIATPSSPTPTSPTVNSPATESVADIAPREEAASPPWEIWRRISAELERSAQELETPESFEQADVLRTAAAKLRDDARTAQGHTPTTLR